MPVRLRVLGGLALFGVAYYLLSDLGISLVEQEGQVAVLWPASGLSLAVFSLTPRRWWPALAATLWASNFVANYLTHGMAAQTFQLAFVNALEPILGASVLLWVTGRERRFVYGSTRGVAGLMAAALGSNAVTAVMGAWVVVAAFGGSYSSAFTGWYIGDGLGMLAIAPLIFAWGDRRRSRPTHEGLLMMALTATASVAILFPESWGAPSFFNRASILLPFLVWTAIRAQPRITSAATALVAVVLTLGTLAGRGPFVSAEVSPLEGVANLQFFLAVAALLPLMVEGVLADRRTAEGRLEASTANLSSVLSAATEVSIVGTDPAGRIDVFNTGAERLLGYTQDEMLGEALAAFHDETEIAARAQELGVEPGFEVFAHAAREGRAETRQWTYVHKNGERIQVSLTVTPRIGESGWLVGFTGIARDITASLRVEAERASLVRTSRAVAAAEPLGTTLSLIASEVAGLHDVDVAAVTRFESAELGTVLGAWSKGRWLATGDPVNLSGDNAAALVSQTGRAARVDPGTPAPGGGPGAKRARAGAPIVIDGRLWGTISIGAAVGDELRPEVDESLARFADLVRLAITNDESRAEIERGRDELLAIIDGLPALVWVQNLAGEVLITNQAFQALASERVDGRPGELMAALSDPALDAEAMAAETTITTEQEVADGAGGTRGLLVSRSPLSNGANRVYALCCVATDITERREVERAKDEFIGVVSHELRTPLSSIRGALSLLADEDEQLTDDLRQRMVEIASTNSERLVALINDILDIQRIAAGASVLELEECDGAALVADAADAMSALAAEKNIALVRVPEDVRILAEPGRVIQILNNYISNAVKFSEPGSRVEVGCTLRDGEAAFYVRDEGRGIPADMLDTIFDRFKQVDSSDSRTVGGTGLGLAICREIAGQHGGRVWAESELGVGSCFWFALALAADGDPVRTITADGATVLICDDDPDARGEARDMVEALGFAAVEAASGETAATLAREERPDVILLDLLMPGMDGYETLSLLSEDEATAPIPVVMISALSPDRVEGPPRPVADWITKPATAERLIAALARARVSARSSRVLVVEDDSGLADVLLERLRRDKIPAVHARSGRQAIELATRVRPELIVLDVGLPDGDGYDVVAELRDRGITPEALIVYSALEFSSEDRRRLELGRTEFVTKSRVSPHEFHRHLAALLHDAEPASASPAEEDPGAGEIPQD